MIVNGLIIMLCMCFLSFLMPSPVGATLLCGSTLLKHRTLAVLSYDSWPDLVVSFSVPIPMGGSWPSSEGVLY